MFADRIRKMNEMYRLPVNDVPTITKGAGDLSSVADELRKFHKTLSDEVSEINEIIDFVDNIETHQDETLAQLADLLADIVVYCYSEALKYGIDLDHVLSLVMDSNETKLGADGNPIYDENGKFLKGPNYTSPDDAILNYIRSELSKGDTDGSTSP